jgi:altronate dehydratase large subunit
MTAIAGCRRADGRIGIRDVVAVVYLVECARFVADAIAAPFADGVHVIGFGGCYPSDYAYGMLERLCTHPNVGAVVLVSLGCEGFDGNGWPTPSPRAVGPAPPW